MERNSCGWTMATTPWCASVLASTVNCSRASWRTRTPAWRHTIHQPLQTIVLPLAGYQYVVEAPPSGLERLFHRMQPVQNFHKR